MDSRYQGQTGCVGKPDGGSGESESPLRLPCTPDGQRGGAAEFFEIVDGKRESLGISEFTVQMRRRQENAEYGQVRAQYDVRPCHASNGVKWFCPDVFNGSMVYVPEELGASVDGDGNVIDVDYRSAGQGDGRSAQHHHAGARTEGERQGNGNGKPAQAPQPEPAPEPPAVVAEWQTPDDAFMWAIAQARLTVAYRTLRTCCRKSQRSSVG